MDSISQFVLGAAVGEAVLGKKIGNKAILLGGIAGTIPDLDVLANPFLSEVDALAFHRGITHSIPFAILASLCFGWLAFKYYKWRWRPECKWELPKLRSFQWLFFWGFFTHTLLDCFTMYGTQLFAPFTDYRIAFSTVSVADPIYTLPFLICVFIACFYNRLNPKRSFWNRLGIIWSCLYLLFTVVNKVVVVKEFEKQLADQNISYSRLISGPTILNNILWSTTVESDSFYYQGQYSLFDKSPIQFQPIAKNHNLILEQDDRTIEILKWFTKGFYNIIKRKDGKLQINDLRYGTLRANGNGEDDYVFRFVLEKDRDGKFKMLKAKGGPEPGDEKRLLASLWERIKGI